MADPTDPTLQRTNQLPYIPTGYEVQSAELQRRRALADAMLQAGLQNNTRMVSPFQLLGRLAQVYAGKSMEGDVAKQQQQLIGQQQADYKSHVDNFLNQLNGLQPGQDNTQVLASAASDPYLRSNPLVDAMIKAQQKRFENAAEVTGAPIQLQVPGQDGKPTMASFQQMKDGTLKPITQGVVAEDLMIGPSGQLLGKQSGKLYGVAPDVSKNTIIGPDGKTPISNDVETTNAVKIAAAGKPDYKATFINTGESAYGKSIGEKLGEQDAATLQAGRDAPKAYQSAARILALLKKNPITGTGATARLALDNALATAGIIDPHRVTATQDLQAEMANTTLANIHASGLGAGQGFTDKDREFLQKAKSGTLEVSADNIRHLAQLNQQAALQARQAGRRVFQRMSTNPATANMVQGLENDYAVPMEGETPPNGGVKVTRIK
jgi:hypothetical protein